ncbi:hypothetical protein UP17_16990 [Peribacillus simplex]|nr:hypothetical protein UP17_16990 [Peribacillus simplex]
MFYFSVQNVSSNYKKNESAWSVHEEIDRSKKISSSNAYNFSQGAETSMLDDLHFLIFQNKTRHSPSYVTDKNRI